MTIERAAGGDRVDRLAHALLVEAVERRRRLVQQQDRRSGQQRAGDREALALAAREHHAALADRRVDAERVALEHLAEVHGAQHALAVGIGCLGRGQAQVVGDRAGQRRGILLDVAELRAQLVAVERADVAPVEQDRAAGRVVEALDEREGRALARAGRPDERDARAARHRERHAAQHVAIGDRSAASVVARPAARRSRCRRARSRARRAPRTPPCGAPRRRPRGSGTARRGTRSPGASARRIRPRPSTRRSAEPVEGSPAIASSCVLGRQVEHLLDAAERAERLVHRRDRAEERAERGDQHEQEHDEGHEARDRDRAGRDAEAAEPEHDEQRHLQRDAGDRHDERRHLGDAHADAVRVGRDAGDRATSRSRRAGRAHGADRADGALDARGELADLLLLLLEAVRIRPLRSTTPSDRDADHDHDRARAAPGR